MAATLKGLLERISIPKEKTPDCWSVLKVEKLLQDTHVAGYEILHQTRVVRFDTQEELLKILLHLVPSEVSHEYHLMLSRFNDTVKVKIGCWQFEAED